VGFVAQSLAFGPALSWNAPWTVEPIHVTPSGTRASGKLSVTERAVYGASVSSVP